MIKSAIIVAGGTGSRMNAGIPKQFLLLGNRPLLMHSISAFIAYDSSINIVLTLPKDQLDSWNKLCQQYQFNLSCTIAEGGETRFHSVQNALSWIPGDHLIAIHDGVRPLVSVDLIRKSYHTAETLGNSIPVTPVDDSLREIRGKENYPVDRALFRLIQTPQVFYAAAIKKAYEQPFQSSFTDDATVMESLGEKINLIEGEKRNIKITLPDDLILANALFSSLSTYKEEADPKPQS